MESNYNNENIERFLRESADQYRMYPSESVWKNIHHVLHTRKRWFGIGLILLLSAGFVTTIMLTNSSAVINKPVVEKEVLPASAVNEPSENVQPDNTPLALYNDNFVQKSGASLLKPFILAPAGNPGNTSIDAHELLAEVAETEKDDSLSIRNGIEEEKNITTAGTVISPDNSPEHPAVFTPIQISFADEATDQDNWVLNNRFIPATRTAPRDVYGINTLPGRLPLTIESVINSYTRKNKRLSFQFYFTPTISYRKLSENKSYLRSLGGNGNNPLYSNINNVVTHKPDMGLELGVAARYALNKNLKVRGGLQFNTSRYDIKAFSYATELTTIALNTGYTVDSVSTLSNYRNFNGYKSDWLHNFYFQISAPVGVELKLVGDDKIQFGIAGTIQPTYILGDRAYVLSSNYKNYAEAPWLIRRWNMNTSFEAFVAYSTGKMNWQVGPQVRYQLHSSFVKEYPVKENLFDFGLKIGVSANK